MENLRARLTKRSGTTMGRVAVIGAGWAGCAAAVELASAGCTTVVYESARQPGGRARAVDVNGALLDNGQHILLGAYRECLRLIDKIGLARSSAFLTLPLQMRYPPGCGGMDFLTTRLPAPWHMLIGLLKATGLAREDKLALARFSTTARWMGWRLNVDCTVSELLERFDQTDRLTLLLWRPLCIAALNTPPERASAQVFLSVLRDSLGAKRAASDMLIPRVDLSALFPQRATEYVEARSGKVFRGATVETLRADGAAWRLGVRGAAESEPFDAVIVAASPVHTARLLEGVTDTQQLAHFTFEPITTCYLQYSSEQRLAQPFYALLDNAEIGHWGQFVFDRGQLQETQPGLMAVVVSAAGNAIALSQDALADAVARQLAEVFCKPQFARPEWARVISEKRATFSCAPGLTRPENRTGAQGVFLAGDYTLSEYPATLESAVRSGVKAAQEALLSFDHS